MRIALFTLGCKLNQSESEGLADVFANHGFTVVKPSEDAELYIVNTCTVTSKAEQKARRMIRKFAAMDHEPVVLVTGCYAQMDPEDVGRLADRLVVVPLDNKADLLKLPAYLEHLISANISLYEGITSFLNSGEQGTSTPFDYKAITFQYHARAFLKIEDGCDNACAYCRVTLARGAAVSLSANQVVARCLDIEREGYREIVFTGVNITAYRDGDIDLPGVLKMTLDAVSGRMRIRLSSLEPDMISDELIEVCRDPRVQPHFHIPIQSASPKLLRAVNRDFDLLEAAKQLKKLLAVKDDPFLAADIITGLPGELDEDAQMTRDFLIDTGFSQVHVFPFSPRPGTALYDAKGKVPEYRRDERARDLRTLSHELYQDYMRRWDGKEVEMIIEGEREGEVYGISANYLKAPIAGLPESHQRGDLCLVKLHRKDEILKSTFIEFN